MKLIIAGSRTINSSSDQITSYLAQNNVPVVTEVVCGLAKGSDASGKEWAENYDIAVAEFPADWDKHGRGAGHIRNAEMAKYGDALLLIWDGESKGSLGMKQQMQKLGKPIYEVIIRKD